MPKFSTDMITFLVLLLGGLSFTGHGVFMLLRNEGVYGSHYLTTQYTAHGGEYFIFFGILLIAISYFSLSPFSKIRKYFEGGWRRRKKR